MGSHTDRYKTTVSSAREKVSIRLCEQKRTWRDWICCYSHIINGKPNMALNNHKSNAECSNSVFD